ncbi:hypothetical protein T484DRAFT_1762140 [Baffinella frigidus]|nr:hypothetical protein T484DRAFT_1762140 [Cryptophyta sp. CCMP2293]
MSGEEAPSRSWRDVAAGVRIVSKESPRASGGTDSLSEAQSRPVVARMFDQLAPSQEQQARRFPSLERRNAYTPQEPRGKQRYNAVAPLSRTSSSPEEPRRQGDAPLAAPSPHEAAGFGRASSNPEEPVWRRQAEAPVFFSHLPTAPVWFPSPQEEVKVMQQSSRQAWTSLGRRFRAAHSTSPAASVLHTPPPRVDPAHFTSPDRRGESFSCGRR